MKNSDIRNDIQSITIKLEEILRKVNLSENEDKSKEEYDINRIMRAAKQYPITEHPLSKNDDHIKKLYITVLSSVIQYDGKPIEERLIFLSRIMQGCNININLMDVIQYGMNIDNNLYDEFVVQISKENLQYNFIVDALIISSCESKIEDKSIEYIAEIASVLNVSNDDMKILCNISNIILMQSQESFNKNLDFIKSKLHYFICYTKEFVDGLLSDNEELFCFRSRKLKEICIGKKILNCKNIDIMNGKIQLGEKNIRIMNKESVRLNNCIITIKMTFTEEDQKTSKNFYGSSKQELIPYDPNEWMYIENCKFVSLIDVDFNINGDFICGQSLLMITQCEQVQLINLHYNNIELRPYRDNDENKICSYINLSFINKLFIHKLVINNCKIFCTNENNYIIYSANVKESKINNCEFINITYYILLCGGTTSSKGINGNECILEVVGQNYIIEDAYLIHGLSSFIDCKIINSPKLCIGNE